MTLTVRAGAVVLGSRSPSQLAAWYRWVFGIPAHDDGTPRPRLIIVHRPELAAAAVEPQRVVTNFFVSNAAAVETRLAAFGSVWVRELERGPYGLIGTVLDPDGNYVQFIERP